MAKIQQQLSQRVPRPIVHHVKVNHLVVAQTRKHQRTDQTAKVVAWNPRMAVAQIITIRHVDQISKDANANMHRMDVALITERQPKDMKMLVAVVNTKNTAVAQVPSTIPFVLVTESILITAILFFRQSYTCSR